MRFVLFPFSSAEKVKELRDWDLFGPLIIAVALTVVMIFKGALTQTNNVFAANFFILMFGSILVTLNAKLVGVKYSFFFYVCVLGCLIRLLSCTVPDCSISSFVLRFYNNKARCAYSNGYMLCMGGKSSGSVL